jgi:hypothetical protein
MTVLSKISSALKRRDEEPNLKLAKSIANGNDKIAVRELVDNLHNKNTRIQNDCIKVLYEVGVVKPSLIADNYNVFIEMLSSKNNRMQWGAMTALATITDEIPSTIYKMLPKILSTAAKGSVITKDNAFKILLALYRNPKHSAKVFPLILEHLLKSPENQFPMYAEQAGEIVLKIHNEAFITLLSSRMHEMEKETKRVRINKIIKKLSK